ncbi:putative 115 kDa protein in type-1 retrotransposable element R1DM [Aphomia sociella]
MDHRFLQTNLNHCARAQDLLMQSVAQWKIDVVVAAEPYRVPDRGNWFGDSVGLVAVFVPGGTHGMPSPLGVLSRGEGYVVVEIGETVVAGVYFSPNRSRSDFESFLDGLGSVLSRHSARPTFVMGDLNAKSTAWGSPTSDIRGEDLLDWVTATGLNVINRGSVATCVRWQGESIVDVTFANPAAARRVRSWFVLPEVETLSDHRYIRMGVSTSSSGTPGGRPATNAPSFPKWALKRLDREVLQEASLVQAWTSVEGPVEVEREANWFREALKSICDAAMPRARSQSSRRQVYWWSEEIADLRRQCMVARRQYTRYRRPRRNRDVDHEAQLFRAYKDLKKALQLLIHRAKSSAWEELLGTLDRDPWGRPYTIVRGKLQGWAPPVTKSLQPQLLEDVVRTLFPEQPEFAPPLMSPADPGEGGQSEIAEVPAVTRAEFEVAVDRLRGETKPRDQTACQDRCLETGRFPKDWKTGRLVLLRKPGRPVESPSAYRPLVLLDETSKLFERVLSRRLVRHLNEVGPELSQVQFGFREGRSTIDAIERVKALSEEVVSQRGVLLAVSLDIENAFNTLPSATIVEALRYHGVPQYLRQIIEDYLRGREIVYEGHNGIHRRETHRGVPQGSVLGPLLWDIGFDWALRGVLLSGVELTCYADDTLVTARGQDYREAARRATAGVAQVVGRIRRLGLAVALHKSRAIAFHGPRKRPPAGSHIIVSGVRIGVEPQMRYLGLDLDSRWNFRAHFANLAPA